MALFSTAAGISGGGTVNFAMGGGSGTGGSGGAVAVNNSNSISTLGQFSSGIIGQSLGGSGRDGRDTDRPFRACCGVSDDPLRDVPGLKERITMKKSDWNIFFLDYE